MRSCRASARQEHPTHLSKCIHGPHPPAVGVPCTRTPPAPRLSPHDGAATPAVVSVGRHDLLALAAGAPNTSSARVVYWDIVRRAQARLFRNRWRHVEAIDDAELKGASTTERARRLAACMRMARDLGVGIPANGDPEADSVRARWVRLKTGRS